MTYRLLPLIALSALTLLPSTARAQDTIAVTATGSGEAQANAVKLRFVVTGTNAHASEAFKSFDSTWERASKAFKELGMDGLEFQGEGLQVGQEIPNQNGVIMMPNGVPQQPEKRISVSEVIAVTVPLPAQLDVKTLHKRVGDVMDAAKDAGLEPVGFVDPRMAYYYARNPNARREHPIFEYCVADPKWLESKAHEAAMDAAREKADQLAKLAGAHITGVHSIAIKSVDDLQSAPGKVGYARTEVTLEVVFTIATSS